MTVEEAIDIIDSISRDPGIVTSNQFSIAKELAIDALLSIKRVRSTCGACLPYLLTGETLAEEELK